MYTDKDYDAFSEKMEKDLPKMFEGAYGGFAINAGWWHIIEDLCRNIQNYTDWKQEQKEKYERGEGCEQVVVRQIKEKFGGLRFYYDGGDAYVDGMVRMAEAWASRTCEVCGAPAKSRANGWVQTLCDEHAKGRE